MRVFRILPHSAAFLLVLAAPAGAFELTPAEHHATIMGLTLDRATFQDAARALGPAEVKHNGGDAGDSAYHVCYVGPDGTTLILASDGEMGGGERLTSFQLLRRKDLASFSGDPLLSAFAEKFQDHARPRCAQLSRLSRAVTIAGGLRLGMTKFRVKPEEGADDDLTFVLPGPKAPVRCRGIGDEAGASVRVELEHGRVATIRVSYWPGEAC